MKNSSKAWRLISSPNFASASALCRWWSLRAGADRQCERPDRNYDAKPAIGLNYYRIKQADNDGRIRYSITVNAKLSLDKNTVSVLANPFTSNIVADFLSTRTQILTSRLISISGTQVFTSSFSVTTGKSRKEFNVGNTLNSGMYIFQIVDDNGEILFNDKLVKL